MNNNPIVLALEIGTSKMIAVTGEILNSSEINVLSFGRENPGGVKKADIIDLGKAASLAQSAIEQAQKKIGSADIDFVYLAISGSQISAIRSTGSANISAIDGTISKQDIERAKSDAKSKILPPDACFINRICCGYYIDGQYVKNPEGRKGGLLEAEYWLMYANKDKILNAMSVVQTFGNLEIEEILHSGIASALACTSPQQRENGVLCIDIGCGATDYAFFKNGKVFQAGTIPVGGDHITNDLSLGLRLSMKNANKTKLKYGKIIPTEDELRGDVWLNGDKSIGDKVIPLAAINKIICVRFEELFSNIRSELSDYFANGNIPEVLLTGGVSRTQDLSGLASTVLGVQTRNARAAEWAPPILASPEYSTVLGLLAAASRDMKKRGKKSGGSIFSNIFKKR
ncbi:MAG: cell division protein FtsA [Opitutales bacterium]|nr:cell division protein FtsA [Opitutales bacterium]